MALDTNLVAHYLLNNNADDNHGSNHGVSTGVTYDGSRAYFNNTNGVTIPLVSKVTFNEISLATFTYSFWVTFQDSTDISGMFGKNNAIINPYNFIMIHGGNNTSLFYANDVASSTISNTPTTNLDHYVFSKIGTTWNLYVNGVNQGSAVSPVDAISISLIGGVLDSDSATHLNAYMSNVRIYSDEKDQIGVDELFAEGAVPVSGDGTLTLICAADATVSYGNQANASFLLTGTAVPYVKGEGSGSLSLTGTAVSVIPTSAVFTLNGTATSTTFAPLETIIGFRFVQEIEQSLIDKPFIFVQEIEQVVPTTIIQRVNV